MTNNQTGFSDATYGAVCAILGVEAKAGLNNRLRELFKNQFEGRDDFTIGDVVNALASSLLKEAA